MLTPFSDFRWSSGVCVIMHLLFFSQQSTREEKVNSTAFTLAVLRSHGLEILGKVNSKTLSHSA